MWEEQVDYSWTNYLDVPIDSLALYNFEIDNFYKSQQINSDITFIQGLVIDSGLELEDGMFDVVTFGDVLHHLIGRNLHETAENQQKAISEIFRITKNGGYVVFNEEVNNVKIFSVIIYYISRFANRFKIRVPFFDAGKVVVLFPTQMEITNMIVKASSIYPVKIIKNILLDGTCCLDGS